GVAITTPTCLALEFKSVKTSISALSDTIQLKKALNFSLKSYPAIPVFKRRKFST
uniref:Uncharacterized protein n=1 Tax=Amphimedon queenslandica TaxID=400682 RepID=A0A1X7TMT2_AMPQE